MDKLFAISTLIRAYKDHPLTLINDKRARISDIEAFIVRIIKEDLQYTTYSHEGILEINTLED